MDRCGWYLPRMAAPQETSSYSNRRGVWMLSRWKIGHGTAFVVMLELPD